MTTINFSVNHSESLANLAKALSKLQSEIKPIGKGSSGYGYNYTDLASIMEYLLPLTSKNNLAITQFGSTKNELITMLIHTESGEFVKSSLFLPEEERLDMKGVNIAQKHGALRSYFKRYAVLEIVGLASGDEDNDASSQGFNKSVKSDSRQENPKTEPFNIKKIGKGGL